MPDLTGHLHHDSFAWGVSFVSPPPLRTLVLPLSLGTVGKLRNWLLRTLYLFMFVEMESPSVVVQVGVQWCNGSSLQPQTPGLKRSSHLSLSKLGSHRFSAFWLSSSVVSVLIRNGVSLCCQAGFELSLKRSSHLTSQRVGITGVNQREGTCQSLLTLQEAGATLAVLSRSSSCSRTASMVGKMLPREALICHLVNLWIDQSLQCAFDSEGLGWSPSCSPLTGPREVLRMLVPWQQPRGTYESGIAEGRTELFSTGQAVCPLLSPEVF
ncbi:hypothetical protein AAY473_020068 [Plecturocebus cupreus]